MKQLLAIFVLMVVSAFASPSMTHDIHVPNGTVLSQPTEVERFMAHMAQRESNNNHRVVNRYGMMGRYQFSPNTVRGLGFVVEKERFLSDPRLQDSVMLEYMRANARDLRHIIDRYDGKTYKGVRISRAGVIAAAHLVGSGEVRRYFSDPTDMVGRMDANGTSLRNYMETFNNYNLQERF